MEALEILNKAGNGRKNLRLVLLLGSKGDLLVTSLDSSVERHLSLLGRSWWTFELICEEDDVHRDVIYYLTANRCLRQAQDVAGPILYGCRQ